MLKSGAQRAGRNVRQESRWENAKPPLSFLSLLASCQSKAAQYARCKTFVQMFFVVPAEKQYWNIKDLRFGLVCVTAPKKKEVEVHVSPNVKIGHV